MHVAGNLYQHIQWQVVSYWQQKGKLPVTIDSLNDPHSGWIIPKDPENGTSYEYTASSTLSFELCATFSRESQDTKGRGAYGGGSYPYAVDMSYPSSPIIGEDTWTHKMGHECFVRTIDPDRYPKNIK